ncbi:hypothetical protein [Pseudomonas sp. RIT-PI-S]|uniref:DUF7716 domain-containing protein n=1 Tax=Pseudomonas sp. RIT-PI-S TaxID=3035295 RepID=UPI0021DA73B3|nr:hypothetical protein [Pseudomonas sp. RIT-PI-S]
MVIYKNFSSLLSDVEGLDKFGTLYANRQKWLGDPFKVEFLLLVGDDELEELDGNGNPILATINNAKYFLDVEIFQNVIELQAKCNPESGLDEYIFAINYYLENDDFYEGS